jgi:nucleotide-binding universal stress UspA family protein
MKILFPVVRSTNVSSELAPLVQNMVKAFRAELHVLYVEPPTDPSFRIRLNESEKWMGSFIANHLAKVTVHSGQVLPGDPAEEILKYADENGIDCIFIGTHGARGLGSVLFGSVAKTIVGKSTVPVLCVNPYLMTNAFKKRNTEYLKKILIDAPPK